MGIRQVVSALACVFGVIVFWGVSPKVAHAAPSLILVEDFADLNPVHRQLVEGLGAIVTSSNLGRHYDHIDLLRGAQATREALFSQIRKRGARSPVDVILLTRAAENSLVLEQGNITDADIRAAGPFPRLRMVYMLAPSGAALLDAWRASGAQFVIGQTETQLLPGFFFPRFLRRWSEGMSASDAAQDAHRFAEEVARKLSSFSKEEQQSRSALGTSHGELVAASEFKHTDFENLAIQVLGGVLPVGNLSAQRIPSAQALVDRLRGSVWELLSDSFPSALSDLPTEAGLPGLPSEEGQEVWIDGDALRYFLTSLRQFGGGVFSELLDDLLGLRMTRAGDSLLVGIYFGERRTVELQDEKLSRSWQPYRLEIPKAVRFKVQMKDGAITLSGLDQGRDALNLKIKAPWPLGTVWLRNASIDVSNGYVRAEAGVFGNHVAVVAKGEIIARKFTGIDLWESVWRNLRLVAFPTLYFQPR